MLFRYRLFLLNWYFSLRNWFYIRLSDGCFKTSVTSAGKTITTLILYALLKNLMRVGFLRKIPGTNTIFLRFDLSRSSIFWSINLQSMENSMVIFVRVCNGSSIIILAHYLDFDLYQIIISFSNSAIDSTGSMLLILLVTLLFLFRFASYLLMSFMYF